MLCLALRTTWEVRRYPDARVGGLKELRIYQLSVRSPVSRPRKLYQHQTSVLLQSVNRVQSPEDRSTNLLSADSQLNQLPDTNPKHKRLLLPRAESKPNRRLLPSAELKPYQLLEANSKPNQPQDANPTPNQLHDSTSKSKLFQDGESQLIHLPPNQL